jgi:hypothetical protein
MRRSSRVSQPIRLAVVTFWVVFAGSALAYDFSLDEVVSEIQFVQEVKANKVDLASLSNEAKGGLARSMSAPGARDILASPLKELCPTGSVQNFYGRQYQFRAIFEKGTMEWILTTPANLGSKIDGLVFFVVPDPFLTTGGGAPAVLPMLPKGARLLPPGELCLTPTDVDLLKQRETEACKKYPDFESCKN